MISMTAHTKGAYWQPAPADKYPIIAYLCIPTRLSRIKIVNHKETITGYVNYDMPLPYTQAGLQRRYDVGGDVPGWLT